MYYNSLTDSMVAFDHYLATLRLEEAWQATHLRAFEF